MKLALGTVQFGVDYGISNQNGVVAQNEVAKILATAQRHKIDLLDTGCAYGNCEQVLGNLMTQYGYQFTVVDKISDIQTCNMPIDKILEQSLQRLKVDSLYGLLLHNAADLNDQTFEQLSELKAQGLIKKIGVSVYYPNHAFDLSKRYDLDLIQLPLNLFDQRFVETECIAWLKQKKVEVHARSLFLQGLLLMSPQQRSRYFDAYKLLFQQFHNLCKQQGISQQVAAFTIAHQQTLVDKFVVGVCSHTQLKQVIEAYQQASQVSFDIGQFSCREEGLISPFLWPQDK